MRKLLFMSAISLLTAASPAAPSARIFSVGGEVLAEADIVDARAQPGLEGQASVLVTLEPDAALRVRATLATPQPMRLEDMPLGELGELAGDSFEIAAPGDLASATALALRIAGKPPLPDSLESDPQ